MHAIDQPTRELAHTLFEALSSGDLEQVRELFHEDATWTVMARDIPGAGAHHGRDEIVDNFLAPVRGMFAPGDPKVDIQNVVAEGPWVAVEAKGRGHFGDGREYDNTYMFVLEFEEGKVRTLREYMDSQYVSSLTEPG